jgi:hypothetical protein
LLELDRIQNAIPKIVQIEERIPYPAKLPISHPIRLIKEAEQQIASTHCVICGRSDLILEQQHVAGRANYSDTVTLCESCHDELSNIYQPKWIRTQRNHVECYFLGWSDIFHLMWVKTKHPYFYELSKTFALNARYAK